MHYLPQENNSQLPVLFKEENKGSEFTERDLLYKVLFDMKKDLNDLKKLVVDVMQSSGENRPIEENNAQLIKRLYQEINPVINNHSDSHFVPSHQNTYASVPEQAVIVEESLSLGDREIELIKKALDKNKGKRKNASKELGISERTLYRKIKEYNIK
jgi:transcriptional regulator with PAS, ATPase and Fis domain